MYCFVWDFSLRNLIPLSLDYIMYCSGMLHYIPLSGLIFSSVYERTQVLIWLSLSTISAYVQHLEPPRHCLVVLTPKGSNSPAPARNPHSCLHSCLGHASCFPCLGWSAARKLQPFPSYAMMASCAQIWGWRHSCQILRTRCLCAGGNGSPMSLSPLPCSLPRIPSSPHCTL